MQQAGTDAHAPVHAGSDGTDEREPGKPDRADTGREPAEIRPPYGKAGGYGRPAVIFQRGGISVGRGRGRRTGGYPSKEAAQ